MQVILDRQFKNEPGRRVMIVWANRIEDAANIQDAYIGAGWTNEKDISVRFSWKYFRLMNSFVMSKPIKPNII